MQWLTIDEDRCQKDGLCAMVCPFRLLALEVGKTFPQPVSGGEERCIQCGHCQAVCPHGALTLQGTAPDWPPFEADRLPNFDQLSQLVRGRRSIRSYKEKAVDTKLLRRCIELAHFAPTARNSQQIGWLVVDNKAELRRLTEHAFDWMRHLLATKDPMAEHYGVQGLIRAWEKGYDGILRHAPGLVVMHGPAGYRLAQMDSTIYLTTFELVAFSQGIGTCWAGFFQIAASSWPPLQEALHLPDGHELTAAMMVGYPRIKYQRLPARQDTQISWRS